MNLCEIKSISVYRNTRSVTVYLVGKKFSDKKLFSGKIILESPPACLLDTHLHLQLDEVISKVKFSERVGKEFVEKEIDRYQITTITNIANTESYTQCVFTPQEK